MDVSGSNKRLGKKRLKPLRIDKYLKIYEADSQVLMKKLKPESFDLIYLDPPYNTGKIRKRRELWYDDNYMPNYTNFLVPILRYCRNLLKPQGSLFLQLDYREIHYAKCFLDRIFSRNCFQNEIIWVYDYGGRSKKYWSPKHDNILWYSKDPKNYTFNYDAIDRIPYMAPGLVGPEKASKGKTPTDVWWQTIVPTNGKEKTGYPTQKPLAILERIIRVHTNPGDRVLDLFAGSGTTGDAARKLKRKAVLVDKNPQAISVMQQRFSTPTIFN